MADQQAKEATSLEHLQVAQSASTVPSLVLNRLSRILRYNTNELLQSTPGTVKQETGRRSLPENMPPRSSTEVGSQHSVPSVQTSAGRINRPTPPAQDAVRHLIHWSTGWIAPALYKLGWRFSAPLSNFHCQLSRRFQANRSHWQGVLCDVLGANIIINNNNNNNTTGI